MPSCPSWRREPGATPRNNPPQRILAGAAGHKEPHVSTVPKLEQNLLEMAVRCLSNLQAYHAKRKLGSATADDAEAFEENYTALNTLLQLAHQSPDGISTDTRIKLEDIEQKETLLLRSLAEVD